MKVLFWGSCVIGVALLLHLIIWKLNLPKRQMAGLAKIFSLVFALWIAGIIACDAGLLNLGPIELSLTQILHISLLYWASALFYTLAYSAIEADSPSLGIIMVIYNAGPEGVEREELARLFNMDKFLSSRMDSLVEDKMAELKAGTYSLLPKGRVAMTIVTWYRKFLGVPGELG